MALLAHYRLDGNAQDSLGRFHGTPVGDVTWGPSKLGSQSSYVPRGSVIECGDVVPPFDLSVSCWVYTGGLVSGVCVSASRSDSTSLIIYPHTVSLGSASNQTRVYALGSEVLVSDDIRDTGWRHLCLTRKGELFKFYIDGELRGTGTRPSNLAFDPRLFIGNYGGNINNRGARTYVEEVRIYDHALSQREVRDLSLGLVYRLPMSGDLAEVSVSGKSEDKGVILTNDSWKFDGSGYVSTDYYPRFKDGDSFSISLWFKTDGTGRVSEIRDSSKPGNPLITLYSDSGFTLLLRGSNGSRRDINTPSMGLNDNKWHHVVAVVNGWSKVYIDGELAGENNNHVDMNIDLSDIPVHVGCRNLEGRIDQYYVGEVKDYRVYHTPLTGSQVKELYQSKSSIDSYGSVHSISGEVISGLGPAGLKYKNVNDMDGTYFNGSNSYAYYEDINGDLQPSEISVSMWVYVVSPSSWRHLLSVGDVLNNSSSWTGCAYLIWMTNERLEVILNGSSYRSPRPTLPTESWIRVGFTYDGSRVKVFVGDSKFSDESYSSSINYSGRDVFQIGGHNRYSWYRGGVRDVAIVGRAVSESEFIEGLGPQTDDIIAWLPMRDETSMINSRGRINKPVSEVGPAKGLVAWYPLIGDTLNYAGSVHGEPESGSSPHADGYKVSDGGISTPLLPSDLGIEGNSAKTMCAWVRFDEDYRFSENGGIFSIGNNSSGEDFSLRTHDDDNLWRLQFHGSSYDYDFNFGGVGQWLHMVVTHDGERSRVYGNGVKIVDQPRTLNTTDDNHPFYMGSWRSGSRPMRGIIRDVRIYDRALTAEEVATLYNITNPDGSKTAFAADCMYTKGQIKEVTA